MGWNWTFGALAAMAAAGALSASRLPGRLSR